MEGTRQFLVDGPRVGQRQFRCQSGTSGAVQLALFIFLTFLRFALPTPLEPILANDS